MATARYQIEIRQVPEEHVLQISEHVPQSDLMTDPNDYETLILWPIGPEGELEAGEPFHREVDSAQ